MHTPHLNCNLCNSSNCELFLTTKYDSLFRCQSCGLVFASSRIQDSNEHYSKDYFIENYLNEEYKTRRLQQAKQRLKEIKGFKGQGRLLDIGCGTGDFLKIANDSGYQAEGAEISNFAQEYCQSQGLKVYLGNLVSLNLPESSFDCITMWDLIEHVSDPGAYLKEAKRLLKNDGLLALKTPNVDLELFKIIRLFNRIIPQISYLLHPYKHLFYFSPETLSKPLELCGFQILKIKMVDELKKKVYHKDLIKSLIKRAYFNSIKNYLRCKGIKESFIIFARKR